MTLPNTYYWNEHQIVRLFNKHSQSGFEIIPSLGGVLNKVVMTTDDQPFSIICGFNSIDDFQKDRWYRSKVLFPFPNRLKGACYRFDNQQYQFPIAEPERRNALHGFPNDLAFEISDYLHQDHISHVTLRHEYRKNYDYYPFSFDLQVRYTLVHPENLRVNLSIINQGDEVMPIGLGWHPYFKLNGSTTDQLLLKLPTVKRVMVDANQIPTGVKEDFTAFNKLAPLKDQQLDDCFEIIQDKNQSIAQTWLWSGVHQRGLRIWQEIGKGKFNFLQVFTPPSRRSVAIEPMSCNIDAFNNKDGLHELAPNKKLEGAFGVDLISSPR